MSNPKKIDISIEKLVSIASAINKNTIANKSKIKEEKIPTDKFVKRFGINRKDFSETIKGTEINYNKSTFLYDIPKILNNNTEARTFDIAPFIQTKLQSNHKVTLGDKLHSNNKVTIIEKQLSNHNVTSITDLKNLPVELQKVINQSAEIDEMLYWYRKHMNDNKLIEVPEIDINNPDLQGDLMVRSFKTYVKVLDRFAIFCKSKKEMQKDLIALALVEFMDTYK